MELQASDLELQGIKNFLEHFMTASLILPFNACLFTMEVLAL